MNDWLNIQKITWRDPLAMAECYADQDMALLYSGLAERDGGYISYLFLDPIALHEGESWEALPDFGAAAGTSPYPDYIGHLGYEMEPLVQPTAATVWALPRFRFVRYRHMLRFDHRAQELLHASRDGSALPAGSAIAGETMPGIRALSSNLTKAQYLQIVADTVARIHAGDFYQANITRKFIGSFTDTPHPFVLFHALASASPAPYSAYIRHGESALLSSSPECFLRIDAQGVVSTRPIKGSARRGQDEAEDAAIRAALMQSAKNHAENLMIVDLMRNDLSRVCVPKSVKVTEQAGLYSYATIHHLISTVEGQLAGEVGAKQALEACFPPGSMTGAPKRAAMAWCREQEQMARGIYSGAIGWVAADGSCDFSVVIRTLVMQGSRFEFQVGGGIVADSIPEEEWRETLIKARGIARALGVPEETLMAL